MDEDGSLATVSLIFLGLIGILICITAWFRCRSRSNNENEFINMDIQF